MARGRVFQPPVAEKSSGVPDGSPGPAMPPIVKILPFASVIAVGYQRSYCMGPKSGSSMPPMPPPMTSLKG